MPGPDWRGDQERRRADEEWRTTAVLRETEERRFRKTINTEALAKLAKMQCTQREMAEFFGFDEDGFAKRLDNEPKLKQIIARNMAAGKISLRRKQMQKAMDGDTTMLIHLGKQMLDQTDKKEVKHEHNLISPDRAAQLIAEAQQRIEKKQQTALLNQSAPAITDATYIEVSEANTSKEINHSIGSHEQ